MQSSSHRMIRCGNCDWNFRIEGNSTRYVLLLHGAFSSGHTWEKIQSGLSKDFTVLVPDLPGHGSSIYYGKKVLDPDCITDELIELRKALKIPHFEFIIGHSAGALIGASYLLIDKQPSKLIGINPYFARPSIFYYYLIKITPRLFFALLSPYLNSKILGSKILDSTNTILEKKTKEKYFLLHKNQKVFRSSLIFFSLIDIRIILKRCYLLKSKCIFILATDDGWLKSDRLTNAINKFFRNASIVNIEGGHLIHEKDTKLVLDKINETISN